MTIINSKAYAYDFRNEWLSKLRQRMNTTAMKFNEAGLCQFQLDDQLLITIYRPADSEYLLLVGQLSIKQITPNLMQKMLVENRNHSKYSEPVLSLSDNLDALEVHFKLTQTELETTENHMDQLVSCLEYWRSYLID